MNEKDPVDRIIEDTDSAQCRVMAHSWEPTTVRRDGVWFVQQMHCHRCDTIKEIDIHSRTGHVGKARYRYGRYVLKGTGGLDQDQKGILRLRTLFGDR